MKDPCDIITSVLLEKALYKTNDPFEFAKKKGYVVVQKEMHPQIPAESYCSTDGTKKITINSIYTEASQKILLAHELGHCIFNHLGSNYYNDSNLDREYQAHLFAVAFLCDPDDFNMDIAEMPSYTLATILDKNIKLKNH